MSKSQSQDQSLSQAPASESRSESRSKSGSRSGSGSGSKLGLELGLGLGLRVHATQGTQGLGWSYKNKVEAYGESMVRQGWVYQDLWNPTGLYERLDANMRQELHRTHLYFGLHLRNNELDICSMCRARKG